MAEQQMSVQQRHKCMQFWYRNRGDRLSRKCSSISHRLYVQQYLQHQGASANCYCRHGFFRYNLLIECIAIKILYNKSLIEVIHDDIVWICFFTHSVYFLFISDGPKLRSLCRSFSLAESWAVIWPIWPVTIYVVNILFNYYINLLSFKLWTIVPYNKT